ncbi:MAG TPA: FHA domain-containing protein, partial [bacterium]|nr:FHA domain-containing protein [bacterium]
EIESGKGYWGKDEKKREQKYEQISGRFLEEFEVYAQSVKESLFRNKEERELDQKSHQLELLEKLVKLELNRKEWGEIVSSRGGIPDKNDLAPHRAFYKNAEARDNAFFENLMSLSFPHEQTLLVAGGFHTQGLTRKFKDAGVSYLLIRPEIKNIPEKISYRDQMRGEVSWRNYFRVENGRVNFYDAFVRATRDRLLTVGAAPRGRPDSRQAQDYGQPQGAAPTLKLWRDQIIRDLAREEKLSEAGDYTRFLDESVNGGTQEKEPSLLQSGFAKIDRFVDALRGLDSKEQLTKQNVLKLLNPAAIQTSAGLVLARRDSLSAEIANGKGISRTPVRSEARTEPVAALGVIRVADQKITVLRYQDGKVALMDPDGHSTQVPEKGPFFIGKMKGSNLLMKARTVSGVHAKITREGEKVFVEDIGSRPTGSTNGTYVWNLQGDPEEIQHWERIPARQRTEVPMVLLEDESSQSSGEEIARRLVEEFGINIFKKTQRYEIDPRDLFQPGTDKNTDWAMHEMRPAEKGPVLTEWDAIPVRKLTDPVESLPEFSEKGSKSAGVYMGFIEGVDSPVAIKIFKPLEKKHSELIYVQIYDRLGIGPRFYGRIVLANGQTGYAMQVVPGKDVTRLGIPPNVDEHREILLRAEEAGLSPSVRISTPSGHLVVIDAGNTEVLNQEDYDKFIQTMNQPPVSGPGIFGANSLEELIEKQKAEKEVLKQKKAAAKQRRKDSRPDWRARYNLPPVPSDSKAPSIPETEMDFEDEQPEKEKEYDRLLDHFYGAFQNGNEKLFDLYREQAGKAGIRWVVIAPEGILPKWKEKK